jgi:hypothetical protein
MWENSLCYDIGVIWCQMLAFIENLECVVCSIIHLQRAWKILISKRFFSFVKVLKVVG